MPAKSPSKSPFMIWLKNLAPGSKLNTNMAPGTTWDWGEGNMNNVGTILMSYFNPSCSLTTQFRGAGASFSWDPAAGLIAAHELLVYVLPSHKESIVVKASEYRGQPLARGGATLPTSKGVIAEVYIDGAAGDPDPDRLLANAVYHELMHNKLDAYLSGGPLQDIHSQGGGGLAVPIIKNGDRPSQRNKELMAQHLGDDHPQCTTNLSKESPYPKLSSDYLIGSAIGKIIADSIVRALPIKD